MKALVVKHEILNKLLFSPLHHPNHQTFNNIHFVNGVTFDNSTQYLDVSANAGVSQLTGCE